jgi:glycosyltransferase involved in cell wall biosynthesis
MITENVGIPLLVLSMAVVRIVYLIPSLDGSGGAEQAVAALAAPLVARGVELQVIVFAGRSDRGSGLVEMVEAAGATVDELPPGGHAGRARAVRGELRRRRPDLVHTTLFEADLAGRAAARLTSTPAVSSLVNVAYGSEQMANPALTPWKVEAARWLERGSAIGVRRFHALSLHVARVMGPRLGIAASRIDVIPRGRDPEQLGESSPARRREVRARLGIADDTPLVVAAARHEYQKGLDVLLSAWPTVQRSRPDAVLLIGGRDGNETASLRRQVDALGRGAGVELIGARRDVADLMVAADSFVVPSRWEGFGSILVEAMALGTTLVATSVEPVPDVVGDGWARLVPPDQPESMGVAIVDALGQSAAESARRAAVASARFADRFHIDVVADATVSFYERALA